MRREFRILSAVLALSLVAGACGAEPDATQTTVPPESTTTTADTTTTSTAETTTTASSEPIPDVVPGEDADVDEIVDMYATVFDSTTSYEEKAALIVDADGLEDTVAAYEASGESVGGVSAEVTGARIDGDTAAVIYTLMFSGNPTYPDLDSDAVRTDDGWKVTRDTFCGIMASARTPCPSEDPTS